MSEKSSVNQLNLFEIPEETEEKQSKGKTAEEFSFDLMDVFQSPVVVFNLSSADTLPVSLRDDIVLGRAENRARQKEEASIPELTAYLHTASLAMPITVEWVKVYQYVVREYFVRWKQIPPQGLPDELKEVELSEYECKELLSGLARFIYSKRRAALKEKLRQTPKKKQQSETSQQQEFEVITEGVMKNKQ